MDNIIAAYKKSPPVKKSTKLLIACLVIVIAFIAVKSFKNTNKYYLKTTDGAVEIWQGQFAPIGKSLLITLPGVQPPDTVKDVYSKDEVFPLAYNYYIEKADAISEMPGMPDFEGIKSELKKALEFASTEESKNVVYARFNTIDYIFLLYKADVAASNKTVSGFETALDYLEKAKSLDLDDIQSEQLENKIKSVQQSIAAAAYELEKAEPVEPESVEPESVEPEAVEPEAVEPEAVEPEAVEPEAVEPEHAEPEHAEPEHAEPQKDEIGHSEIDRAEVERATAGHPETSTH